MLNEKMENNTENVVGRHANFSKTITETDIVNFAGICGDFNPIHINEIEASKSIFGKRIAHGMIGASLLSTVLGMYMPGPGTILLEQSLRFLKPVFINDTLTAYAEIQSIDEQHNANVLTVVSNQKGEHVIEGIAKVKLPRNK